MKLKLVTPNIESNRAYFSNSRGSEIVAVNHDFRSPVWWSIKTKFLLQKILISKVNLIFTLNLKSKLNLNSISF